MHVVLSEDEIEFRDKCRKFAKEVIEPNYIRFDRENRFPDVVHDEAVKRGLLNVCFPKELGGGGVSFKAMAEGGFELAKVCPATTFTMGFSHGAMRPIMFAGTPEQKQTFVKEHIAKHRGYTSLALTEEDVAGSNLIDVRTRADKTDRGWVISGKKVMVGMGTMAQQYLVLADTYGNRRRLGLSFFVVPRTGDVEVGENTEKLGFHAVPTPEVNFKEVRVDDHHLIGEAGGAEPILCDVLDFIRYGGGIIILGTLEGAMRDAVPWLAERKVYGDVRLIEKSHIQLTVGSTFAHLQVLRLLLRRAADLLDRGLPVTEETGALKLLASELVVSAGREVLQMYGWKGIDNKYPIQKRFRDAQQTTIFEGTSEVLKLNFCRAFLKKVRDDVLE